MTSAQFIKQQKGFTLIELLVVMGILAILLAIVLIAINPARQFGQANNTRRTSDVTQLLNAIGAYAAENAGQPPSGILVGTPADASVICADIMPKYIPSLPADPTKNSGAAFTACPTAGADVTGYSVVKDNSNHVTVTADHAENGTPISITR